MVSESRVGHCAPQAKDNFRQMACEWVAGGLRVGRGLVVGGSQASCGRVGCAPQAKETFLKNVAGGSWVGGE